MFEYVGTISTTTRNDFETGGANWANDIVVVVVVVDLLRSIRAYSVCVLLMKINRAPTPPATVVPHLTATGGATRHYFCRRTQLIQAHQLKRI